MNQKLEQSTFKELEINQMFVESYGGTFGNELKVKATNDKFIYLGYNNEFHKIEPDAVVYIIDGSTLIRL